MIDIFRFYLFTRYTLTEKIIAIFEANLKHSTNATLQLASDSAFEKKKNQKNQKLRNKTQLQFFPTGGCA